MYDYSDDEVRLVGWEPFVTRQWELIFSGYTSGAGLRRSARRWSDLLVGGADLPQAVADQRVRAAVIDRPDLAPEDAASDPDEVRLRMLAVLDLMSDEQADSPALAQLVRFLREFASGDAL